MSTRSFTLTGKESILSHRYFPPIELNENRNYSIGLTHFVVYNSVPNIEEGNNLFHFGEETIEIPIGSYEIEDIENYLKQKLRNEISLKANHNTLRCEIQGSKEIDFTKPGSIGRLLGFGHEKLAANILHSSTQPVDIVKLNVIIIDCNIVSGAYINERESHAIYQFAPVTSPGFKIIEIPHNILYLPVKRKQIDNISLSITDQDGRLLNFRGETITVGLHLKEDGI